MGNLTLQSFPHLGQLNSPRGRARATAARARSARARSWSASALRPQTSPRGSSRSEPRRKVGLANVFDILAIGTSAFWNVTILTFYSYISTPVLVIACSADDPGGHSRAGTAGLEDARLRKRRRQRRHDRVPPLFFSPEKLARWGYQLNRTRSPAVANVR